MGDRLKNTLQFISLAPGASVVLPHGLVSALLPLAPDVVFIPHPELEVASDDIAITLTNKSGAALSGSVLVEHWHTIEREFGDVAVTNLPVRPYVIVSPEGGNQPPWPVFPSAGAVFTPVFTTIYARLTGNDTTGNGSLALPYRTFQRAIRDVPHLINPGYGFVVDCTGIGEEVFPAGYQMPPFQGPSFLYTVGDPSTGVFSYGSPLNIRAQPQLASNITTPAATVLVADYAMAADPDTNLAILTLGVARPSWVGNALKGKMLIGSDGSAVSSAIYGSDATHLYLCNDAGNITGDLTVVEPSATFRSLGAGQDATVFETGGGFECMAANAVAFQGIKFVCDDPAPAASGLAIVGAAIPVIELCDIAGLTVSGGLNATNMVACVIRDKELVSEPAAPVFVNTLVTAIPIFCVCSSVEGIFAEFTVFDACTDSLGDFSFLTDAGALIHLYCEMLSCLWQGSAAPKGALVVKGGLWSLQNVQLNGCSADAIVALGSNSHVILNHVTGTANGGVGIRANDGATVRVIDDATNIGEDNIAMAVGTLATRSWANFRGVAPKKNQFDLLSPPVGDEVTGAGTGGTSGSRLFQRPL